MATQLLKTVKPSGGDYTSLEACMNANEQNLVTANKYFDVEIDGDWSGGADTTAVTIHNYTTDATRYINIYTTATARHKGVYSTSYYRLYATSNTGVSLLSIGESDTTITGIQSFFNSTNYDYGSKACAVGSVSRVLIDKCIFIHNRGTAFGESDYGEYPVTLRNSIFIRNNDSESAGSTAYFNHFTTRDNSWPVDNCVFIHHGSGIAFRYGSNSSSSQTVRNSYAYSASGTAWYGESDNGETFTTTTCASNDGSNGTTTVAYSTDTFTNVTPGSEDFHLVAGSGLLNIGTDLSATFTTDIDGETRSKGGTWDIGVDYIPPTQLLKTVKPSGGDYTSLEACMNANEQNLVTANKYFDVEIDGDWSGGSDTTAVTIHNYTTDSGRCIHIYTTSAARHTGKPYSSGTTHSGYAIKGNTAYGASITISGAPYTWIEGLIINQSYYFSAGTVNAFSANLLISNCIIMNTQTWGGTETTYALSTWAVPASVVIENTIFITEVDGSYGIFRQHPSSPITLYNVTIFNKGATERAVAVSAGYNVAAYYATTTYTSSSNNYSSGTLTDFNFVDTTAGVWDLHLTSSSTNLIDAGVDKSANTVIDTDIDGDTRTGAWDIGADEYVVTGSTSSSVSSSPSSSISSSPSPSSSLSSSVSSSSSSSPSSSISTSLSSSVSSSPSPAPSWDVRSACLIHYKLEENAANTTVVDTIGTSNATANANTSTLSTTGKLSNGFNFAGSGTSFSANSSLTSLLTSEFSFECWFNPSAITGTGDLATYGFTIAASATSGSGYPLWLLHRGGEIRVSLFDNSATGQTTSSGAGITTGNWYHLVVSAKRNANSKVYLNGAELMSFTSKDLLDWSTTFCVGDLRLNRLVDFEGVIDNVRLFNRQLTVDEVAGLYNGGAGTEALSGNLSSPSSSVSESPSSSVSSSPSPSSSLSSSVSASLSSSVSSSVSSSPSPSSSVSSSLSSSVSASPSPSPSPGYTGYTKGDNVTLPTNDDDLETNYSAQDLTDVSTKNTVTVDQGATDQYAIHQFKDYTTANSCFLEWEGQSNTAPSASAVYLQIYNRNTTTWDTLTSNNTAAADTNFSLTYYLSDLTNYRDGNNVISCRVYQ